MSRATGDPITLYPAWGHHLEAALCGWASARTSNDVFRSLLAVVQPEEWPVSPEEQTAWRNRKRVHGSFRLSQNQPTPILNLPSPADFLAAAVYLRVTGSIAWTTANRTAQRRLDGQAAASTLALLVAFGLAAPTEHWQRRHLVLPAATAIIICIVADLARTGRLSWNEATLADLRNAEYAPDLGWCDRANIVSMLDAAQSATAGLYVTGDAGLGDLDSIFGSEDWGTGFSPDPS